MAQWFDKCAGVLSGKSKEPARRRRYEKHVNCLTSKEVSYIKDRRPEPRTRNSRSLPTGRQASPAKGRLARDAA